MARIRVCFRSIQSANQELKRLTAKMERIEEGLAGLQRETDPEIQRRYEIKQKLKAARMCAKSFRTKAQRLHKAVENGAEQYRATEARLNRHTPDNGKV